MKSYRSIFSSCIGAALALCAAVAVAAPAALPDCWPKQIGATGSSFVYGETSDARSMSWNCVTKSKVTTVCIAGLKAYMPKVPDTKGLTAVMSARAYWTANVTDAKDARLSAACKVTNAAAKPLRP